MTTIDYGALDRDASTLRASSALQMSPRQVTDKYLNYLLKIVLLITLR